MKLRASGRTWVTRVLILLFVAVLFYFGGRLLRAAISGRSALVHLARLQAVADAPALDQIPAVRQDLAALELDLVTLRAAARPFLALAPRLGGLPRIGSDVAAAPALLDMAIELAGGGRAALEALAPLAGLAGAGQGLDTLPAAAATLAASAPTLADARKRLALAGDFRRQVDHVSIDRASTLLGKLDKWLPLATDGLDLAGLLPALLGAGGERTYLVLAQNNHELRATGGFISAVGVIRFNDARLDGMTFSDSYAVDDLTQPHPQPPEPLTEQMGLDMWMFRDANWSPDFPESAEVARALYAQDKGVYADGVIALDLDAVQMLVAALGPLQVPGVDEPVTGSNAIEWMKRAWQAPSSSEGTVEQSTMSDWWLKRKDFMSELVAASLSRIEGGADIDAAALGRAVVAMLNERHLQVYVDSPEAARVLARQEWDGALRYVGGEPAGADFLAIVDSNVGFNKANAAIRQAIDYAIAGSDDGATATVRISYDHLAPAGSEQACDRRPRYGDSYDELVRRCYWDYMRVYVPDGAELLDAEGLLQVKTEPGDGGTAVFEGDFVLAPGDHHTVTLRYRLPASISLAPYRLTVRKQAGTDAIPVTLEAAPCHAQAALATDWRFACPEVKP